RLEGWWWTLRGGRNAVTKSPGMNQNQSAGFPKWGEEDCVHIVAVGETEKNWNDLRCVDSKLWSCEKAAQENLSVWPCPNFNKD
uniref:C-type lectin domain-containing protein n=1 Tax=Mola mola TaxID=94237 RepID=A0A3Q3XH98_MOLML